MNELTPEFPPPSHFVDGALTPEENARLSDDLKTIQDSASDKTEQIEQTVRRWLESSPALDVVQQTLAETVSLADVLMRELNAIPVASELQVLRVVTEQELVRLDVVTKLLESTVSSLELDNLLSELPLTTVLEQVENLLQTVREVGADIDDTLEPVSSALEQRVKEQQAELDALVDTANQTDTDLLTSSSTTPMQEELPTVSFPSAPSVEESTVIQPAAGLVIPGEKAPISFTEGLARLNQKMEFLSQKAVSFEEVQVHVVEAFQLNQEIDRYLKEVRVGDPDRGADLLLQKHETMSKVDSLDGKVLESIDQYNEAIIPLGVSSVVKNVAVAGAFLAAFNSSESIDVAKAPLLAKKSAEQMGIAAVYPHFVFILLQGPGSASEVTGKDLLLQKAALLSVYQAVKGIQEDVSALAVLGEKDSVQGMLSSEEYAQTFKGQSQEAEKLHNLLTAIEAALPEDKRVELHNLAGRTDDEADFLRHHIFAEHLQLDTAITALVDGVPVSMAGTLHYVSRLKEIQETLDGSLDISAAASVQDHNFSLNKQVVDFTKGLHDLIINQPVGESKHALFATYTYVLQQGQAT